MGVETWPREHLSAVTKAERLRSSNHIALMKQIRSRSWCPSPKRAPCGGRRSAQMNGALRATTPPTTLLTRAAHCPDSGVRESYRFIEPRMRGLTRFAVHDRWMRTEPRWDGPLTNRCLYKHLSSYPDGVSQIFFARSGDNPPIDRNQRP